ncbi:hypothetical protein TWF694_010725 [Orbilia ellipsospora]|uniref:Uncharacterized protein n=1 Tax=Orbilia ellipsospora TaxID=2528407 RepID=A0AAV9X827_9PEZI
MDNTTESADKTNSRPSRSRVRAHIATYPLFQIVNNYTPFGLPALVLDKAPSLPETLDAAVDDGLTAADNFVEARVGSMKKRYERWVVRPQENIKTGINVYADWGKWQVAGGIRQLEEGIFTIGEYLLPVEDEDERMGDDHEHAGMNSYWTSTESVIDTSDDDSDFGTAKDGRLRPLTPASSVFQVRQRSASAPSLPPFESHNPRREVENMGRLLVTYAHRTYARNAHKSPAQMLYDALDLARSEARKVKRGLDEKYSIEIGYLQRMMEAGRPQ